MYIETLDSNMDLVFKNFENWLNSNKQKTLLIWIWYGACQLSIASKNFSSSLSLLQELPNFEIICLKNEKTKNKLNAVLK